MILHRDFLFISNRKCATNTLYAALQDIGGRRVGGFHAKPQPGRHAPKHFTIVRNPYDRAVSIWASTCMRGGDDRYGARAHTESKGLDPDRFADFALACLDGVPFPSRDPWLFRNQSDWLADTIVDYHIKIEEIETELPKVIGRAIKLPVLNDSDHQYWRDYMSPQLVSILNEWAGIDFLYGYDRI